MNDPATPTAVDSLPAPLLRKLTWRLIPFLCLLYALNLLDRSNVGFAALKMQDALALSTRVFDLGIGIFYFGYLFFEVPSNLLLRRVGARRWIARIMITWGAVTCATAAVTGVWSFYGARILLGVAEAGFFPGIVLYLTYWFPARERARVMAWFMTANAFAGVFGLPLSGAIMQYLDGAGGLAGWQWLFILEGLPSVVVGFAVFLALPDGPEQAPWLTEHERAAIHTALAHNDSTQPERHVSDFLRALFDPRVLLLIALYFTVAVGANASSSYFPRLIKNRFEGHGEMTIGLLSALPHVFAIVGMTLLSGHSDRTGERGKHVALAAFLAAGGWTLSAVADHPWVGLAGFCVAQTGMMSMLPIFWAIPTAFLRGAAAAGGIALINSVANLGGLFGPTILGQFGLGTIAGILCAGGVLALCVRSDAKRTTDPPI